MLWTPPPKSFSIPPDNLDIPVTATHGTTLQASASLHTKGLYSELVASAATDFYSIMINVTDSGQSGGRSNQLLDIAIGPEGSEVDIISDLAVGWRYGTSTESYPIILPIFIPKNSRVSARIQAEVASDTCEIEIRLMHGACGNPVGHRFSKWEAHAVTPASTSGVSLISSTTNYGSWLNLGGTTARNYSAFMPMVFGVNSGTAMNNVYYYWQFGYNDTAFATVAAAGQTVESFSGLHPLMVSYVPIPSGTQMQWRGHASSASSQSIQFAVLMGY